MVRAAIFALTLVSTALALRLVAPTPLLAQAGRHEIAVHSAAGLRSAIKEARETFRVQPNSTVVVSVAGGTYSFDSTIELDNLQPGPQGSLLIQGEGPDRTHLLFPRRGTDWLHGRKVFHVALVGLHMGTTQPTTSQGHVVSVAPGEVILDIQDGFATPADIFDTAMTHGRFLRRYTDSATDPQVVEQDNVQEPFNQVEPVGGARWRFKLKRRATPAYRAGDLVGIKSKQTGQAYWFSGGSDLRFENVWWTGKSRGVFRGGLDHVAVVRCCVPRGPAVGGQVPCLSTPDGGPQIGQPDDPAIADNLVEDCHFAGTGDDAIAFFNAGGVIRRNRIEDSFSRGILLYHSPGVTLKDNDLLRCPLLRTDHLVPNE